MVKVFRCKTALSLNSIWLCGKGQCYYEHLRPQAYIQKAGHRQLAHSETASLQDKFGQGFEHALSLIKDCVAFTLLLLSNISTIAQTKTVEYYCQSYIYNQNPKSVSGLVATVWTTTLYFFYCNWHAS